MSASAASNAARNAAIVALRGEGVGPREIARRLGLSPGVVSGVLHRAGIVIAPQSDGSAYPESTRRSALALAGRIGVERAAAEAGVAERTLWDWRAQSQPTKAALARKREAAHA